MASISTNTRTGNRVAYVCIDSKRPKVALGRVTKRQAETAKRFIEDLAACRRTGDAMRAATAEWVAGLPDKLHRRLERIGLVTPREQIEIPRLPEWLRQYIDGRTDVKPGTLTNLKQTEGNLVAFFGDRAIDDVTEADADAFRIHLLDGGLARATVNRRCKRARQFFGAAVKARLINENPFAGMKCGNFANETRRFFVTGEMAEAVLAGCPDARWRLIFALCRYGGLRCPSEIRRLRWGDVLWDQGVFVVHADKTAHHPDGGVRRVPIFPELRPHLQESFDLAPEGTRRLVPDLQSTTNLRTQLHRIIRRAGLTPWPKLFQNLRSTRETELAERFPMHVVCEWIGNSQPVAAKHYLQVTEAHVREAQEWAHFRAQHRPAIGCTGPQGDGLVPVCGSMQASAAQALTPRRLELRLPG